MCGTIPATENLMGFFSANASQQRFRHDKVSLPPKRRVSFLVPLYPELQTQLYKQSSQQEAGKRNGPVCHHTWWATIIGCRASKGGDIKSTLYILNFQEGGKKMEEESTTWTGSCCCYLVISEAWSSRADLQGKSLKHIIRAEIGKLKSSVPLTHILRPTCSLIFIVPFHLLHTPYFTPEHIGLLSRENWASNLQRGQEMTHHLTAVSQDRPRAPEWLIPAVGGEDNAYYLTITQHSEMTGSCGE